MTPNGQNTGTLYGYTLRESESSRIQKNLTFHVYDPKRVGHWDLPRAHTERKGEFNDSKQKTDIPIVSS